MLLDSPLQEVKRREAALEIINQQVKKNRNNLYDLTGLSGGFPLKPEDIKLLETYAGASFFEDKLQPLALEHLGGEKALALNRTSSGILACTLALVKPGNKVVHILPEFPSHPIIPRSVKLIGADYFEFKDTEDYEIGKNTDLVIITGSTMDHQIIKEDSFRNIIETSKSQKIPVLVDDASGARLRTILYKQPRALDMGADLVITSTDKLMDGPRGGLLSGKSELVDQIKSKAHQYGLEAQPPLTAGMVRALEKFNPERITKSQIRRDKLFEALREDFNVKKTPTGIMLLPEDIMDELEEVDSMMHQKDADIRLEEKDAAGILAMILLRDYQIITIPAVGMPGASPTIRMDMASKDAERLDIEYITQALGESFLKLKKVIVKRQACENILFAQD